MDDARQIAEHCAGQREADEEVTLVEPGELRVEAADPPQPLSAAEGRAEGHGTAVAQARSYAAVVRHRPTDVAIDDAPVLVDAPIIRAHDRDPAALRPADGDPPLRAACERSIALIENDRPPPPRPLAPHRTGG